MHFLGFLKLPLINIHIYLLFHFTCKYDTDPHTDPHTDLPLVFYLVHIITREETGKKAIHVEIIQMVNW